MTFEQHARQGIEAQLLASGWIVQDFTKLDLSTGRGIALREVLSSPRDAIIFCSWIANRSVSLKPRRNARFRASSPSNPVNMPKACPIFSLRQTPARYLFFTNPPTSKFFSGRTRPRTAFAVGFQFFTTLRPWRSGWRNRRFPKDSFTQAVNLLLEDYVGMPELARFEGPTLY
jgi:hypothetical protein